MNKKINKDNNIKNIQNNLNLCYLKNPKLEKDKIEIFKYETKKKIMIISKI